MRVTKAAIAQWQEVSLPGKVDGHMRVQYHDVLPEEAGLVGTTVEMLDGAQALWHSHPRGQIFFAISGLGQIQVDGGILSSCGLVTRSGHPLASVTATARRPATISPSARSTLWTQPLAPSSTGDLALIRSPATRGSASPSSLGEGVSTGGLVVGRRHMCSMVASPRCRPDEGQRHPERHRRCQLRKLAGCPSSVSIWFRCVRTLWLRLPGMPRSWGSSLCGWGSTSSPLLAMSPRITPAVPLTLSRGHR